MNLGQIRTRVRKRLGDANSAFWSDDELNDYINDGLRDISFRTKCIRDNGYITSLSCEENLVSTVSNEYALSTNFPGIYSVLEVYFFQDGREWIRIKPTQREELDEESSGWRQNVGYVFDDGAVNHYNYDNNATVPRTYYWSREEDIIGFDPPPNDDNAGTDYIRVYYAKKHTDLVGDSDDPQVPEPLHLSVIDYVVAVGFDDRGWGDRANDAWTKYYTRLKDYKIERNREREDDEIQMGNR